MKQRLSVYAVLLLAVMLSGCATPTRMAFEDKNERITDKSKPILLMTATIKNDYKVGYQPQLLFVSVEKKGATDAKDRFNFKMDDLGREETNAPQKGNTYLLRMPIEPGTYQIVGLTSVYNSFFVHAMFFTPLAEQVVVKGPGVYYLGHVDAVVRERKGDEPRAGSPLPLIDQSVAGASGGTFDVKVSDQADIDEPAFRQKFSALSGITIEKQVLPPVDLTQAAAAQQKQ